MDAAIANRVATLNELLSLEMAKGTVSQLITDKMASTGEKMELGFYENISAPYVTSYIHMGNKLASIVGFNKSGVDEHVAKDIAMQIAAMNPIAISAEDVPEEVKERELKIAREKAIEEGKPEHIIDNIAKGSLGKFYKLSTLLEQEYVKEPKKSVAQFLEESDKSLEVVSFKRVSLNV